MKNFGKIISDKDVITKEYLDSKGYISAITSKMVTDALGFTPFDSAAFTKGSIKNALGIADWALAASKPSYDDRYLKLSGGTINGVLSLADELRGRPLANPVKEYVISQWRFISAGDTVYLQAGTANGNTNGNLAFSGYSGQAAEDIYFNAKSSRFNGSLKVQPGWDLYLNGEAITKWSDLKSKIAYSFSEISSKPTTLSGYGITDAVKQGVNFAPTSATSPTIIGYSGIGEGWPAGGPAMRWGIDGYYARLQVELNTNNPRLLLSGVYNNTAYEWVEILTDKNFSSFGIANMSNDASGSANDILTSSVNGVIERLTDIPIRYGSLLTFAAKNAFYRGQLIINYQSDMAIRCHDGRWSDWAKVVTDKNFASYGVKAGNFNTTGSANDITVPSIVGDFESLQNMPFHYCNVLTITTTPHYYVGQIAIDYTGRMAVRGQDYDGVTWSSWRTILDTNNIGDYAMSKAGGTIDGNLTINGEFKTQTTLGHVSLFSNIFEVNASLKVLSGWALYLNGKGIQQWSDLGTYITPISSETTSAKTIFPNTFYKWGSVSALSITLGAATNNTHINNYMFEFTASTGFALGGLSGVKWADGVKPNIKAGYTYQFSIINNCATYSAFKTA